MKTDYKSGDKVYFRENYKDFGTSSNYKKVDLNKEYTIDYPGTWNFTNCMGNTVCIQEIYGGWIPIEAISPTPVNNSSTFLKT